MIVQWPCGTLTDVPFQEGAALLAAVVGEFLDDHPDLQYGAFPEEFARWALGVPAVVLEGAHQVAIRVWKCQKCASLNASEAEVGQTSTCWLCRS